MTNGVEIQQEPAAIPKAQIDSRGPGVLEFQKFRASGFWGLDLRSGKGVKVCWSLLASFFRPRAVVVNCSARVSQNEGFGLKALGVQIEGFLS